MRNDLLLQQAQIENHHQQQQQNALYMPVADRIEAISIANAFVIYLK